MIGWYNAEDSHPWNKGIEVFALTRDTYGNLIKVRAVWNGKYFKHDNNSKVLYWQFIREEKQL